VPETNGKTLEEMDEVFNDRSGVEDITKKERTLREVYDEKVARDAA
jgi:acetate kinase